MRLIDANRLLNELNFIAREQFSLSDGYGKFIHTLINVEKLICEQPIVEIVRCKDCKNWKKTMIKTVNGEPLYGCPLMNGEWGDEDGYCYWGKRREEGDTNEVIEELKALTRIL